MNRLKNEEGFKLDRNLIDINFFTQVVKYNIDLFLEENDNRLAKIVACYIKNATNGNLKDREELISFIKTKILTNIKLLDYKNGKSFIEFGLENEEYRYLIDCIINFEDSQKLTNREKFSILLYKYREINILGYDKSFDVIRQKYSYVKNNVNDKAIKVTNIWYEYNEEDLSEMYSKENFTLDFYDKINIISQRIYEDLYGLGCIDVLAYSDINEVGIANDGKYIYAWASDKIHLSFLSLTEHETRIIQDRSILFDDKVGALNISNPEVLCYRADNARITALQPPYCSARTLCIRIFNKRENSFKQIIQNDKQQILIQALIRTGQKISLQGGLGTGKTTAMQVMLEVLDDQLHIGTVEDYFEQHNMLKYPNKRIIELQECLDHDKNLLQGVMSLFRLSVDVTSVGEARDGNAVFSFIQLSQAIENSAFLTSHIASPEDTVSRYKNMLIASNIYMSEQAAISDIINYINIVFQHETVDGVRRITKIVEIVPQNLNAENIEISIDTDEALLKKLALIQQIQQNTSYMYKLNTLMIFDGEYKFVNYPSKRIMNKMKKCKELENLFHDLLFHIENDLKEN